MDSIIYILRMPIKIILLTSLLTVRSEFLLKLWTFPAANGRIRRYLKLVHLVGICNYKTNVEVYKTKKKIGPCITSSFSGRVHTSHAQNLWSRGQSADHHPECMARPQRNLSRGRRDYEGLTEHAGYKCLGCNHTWGTFFALTQHRQSPTFRGTACGDPESSTELRNIPSAHHVTGLVRADPLFQPGSPELAGKIINTSNYYIQIDISIQCPLPLYSCALLLIACICTQCRRRNTKMRWVGHTHQSKGLAMPSPLF
jgi:hypothetical protein